MKKNMLCSENWQWERVGGRSEARPTTLERLHEGSRKAPLTQTLTKEFTGMRLDYVRMILPQVHLRKPCYDFSFL